MKRMMLNCYVCHMRYMIVILKVVGDSMSTVWVNNHNWIMRTLWGLATDGILEILLLFILSKICVSWLIVIRLWIIFGFIMLGIVQKLWQLGYIFWGLRVLSCLVSHLGNWQNNNLSNILGYSEPKQNLFSVPSFWSHCANFNYLQAGFVFVPLVLIKPRSLISLMNKMSGCWQTSLNFV